MVAATGLLRGIALGFAVHRYCGAVEMTVSPKTIAIDSTVGADAVIPSSVELSCSLAHMVLNGTGYKLEVQGLFGTASQHACIPLQGTLLCHLPFNETGTQRLAMYSGKGELLGASVIEVFRQPVAEYLRPFKMSLAGSDPFSLKLGVENLPVGNTDVLNPIVRFEHSGMAWTVSPTVSTKEGSVFLTGLSPSFASNIQTLTENPEISGIQVFYSLNGLQFSQALSKHGESISAVSLPAFKVGFIYHMTPDFENGFVYAQNEARLTLTVTFPGRVETSFVENQKGFGPDQCGDRCGGPHGWCAKFAPCANYVPPISHSCYVQGKRMLDELGYDMIVGTTFEYWPDLRQLAIEHPGKYIVGTSPGGIPPPGWGGVTASNLGAARSKLWQGIYMQGYALGLHPEVRSNPRVGYITPFSSSALKDETAVFAKGLHEGGGGMIDFRVYEVHIFSWHHPTRERIAAERLFKHFNISAISTLCNSMEAYIVAKEFNGYSTALNVDATPVVGKSVVVSQISNWRRQLERFVHAALANISWWGGSPDGTGISAPGQDLMYGADQDGWFLTTPSPTLPAVQQRLLRDRMDEFKAGHDDIFCNTLRVFEKGIRRNVSLYGGSPGTCRTDCLIPAKCDWAAFWKQMRIESTCSNEEQKVYNPTIKDKFCYLGPMNVSHDVPDSCPLGTVLSTVGCVACPLGKSHDSHSDVCVTCARGWFSDKLGASQCDSCRVGFFADERGSTSCSICERGQFAAKLGSAKCLNCTLGTFLASRGQSVCERCHVGTYAADDGVSACTSCDDEVAGRTTLGLGSISEDDCGCAPKSYLAHHNSCQECPHGISCAGFAGENVVLPGFYAELPLDPSKGVWICSSEVVCIGQTSSSDDLCAMNSEGLNCARCKEGASRASDGGCEECTTGGEGILPSCMILMLLASGAFHWAWNEHAVNVELVESVLASITVGVTVAFLQQVGVMQKLQLNWPREFMEILAAAKLLLFDMDYLRIHCVIPESFEGTYMMGVAMPLVIAASFAVWWPLSRIIHMITQRVPAFRWSAILNSIGMVMQALYISVTSSVVGLFMCYESGPNKETVLTAYPWERCFSTAWWRMFPVAVLGCLVYILGFLALLCWLAFVAPAKWSNHSFRVTSRFLVFKFRMDKWWYGIVLVLRSLAQAMVPVVSPDDGYVQFFLLLFILVFGLVIHLIYEPYVDEYANLLESVELSFLIVILAVGSWFIEDRDLEGRDKDQAYHLAIVLCVSFTLCACTLFGTFCYAASLLIWARDVEKRQCAEINEFKEEYVTHCKDFMKLDGDSQTKILTWASYIDLKRLKHSARFTAALMYGLQSDRKRSRRLISVSPSFCDSIAKLSEDVSQSRELSSESIEPDNDIIDELNTVVPCEGSGMMDLICDPRQEEQNKPKLMIIPPTFLNVEDGTGGGAAT